MNKPEKKPFNVDKDWKFDTDGAVKIAKEMNKLQEEPDTWVERFDERFPPVMKQLLARELSDYPNLTDEFWGAQKQFIAKEIDKAKEEAGRYEGVTYTGKAKEIRQQAYEEGRKDLWEDIKSEIENK